MDAETAALAAIISACTGLAAVIIGPIVTYMTVHHQVVKSSRQDWINTLREDLSKLLGAIGRRRMYRVWLSDEEENLRSEFLDDQERIERLHSKILLLLNHKEPSQEKLASKLHEAVLFSGDPTEHGKKVRELLDATRIVLKSEWTRVKAPFED